jgi:glutamate racemase
MKKTGRTSVTGFARLQMPEKAQRREAVRSIHARLFQICSAMIDGTIAFLDSGIGGLPYLEWVRTRRPDLDVSYIADSEHFPYGELPAEQLRFTVVETVKKIFSRGTPRLLVIACNTASVTALDAVREFSPCPVVGTVPAVKPAAVLTGDKPIGVLATKGTINSPYLDRLISAFAPAKSVVRVAAAGIVRFVEEEWMDQGDEAAGRVMEPALSELRSAGVGSVVLGCTHFLHLLKPIRAFLGPDVILVDSRDGVGRRILSLLGEEELTPAQASIAGAGTFYVTSRKKGHAGYPRFSSLYGLEWAGVLI